MKNTYDVIVAGGGTAGITAAIQSARAGARTLLLEKNAILGGTMTVGGISAPAHFFAWGRRIIAGIGWELVCRTLAETGRTPPTPEFTRDNPKPRHVSFDRTIFAALCDQAVIDAGADVLFHAMPARADFRDGAWRLEICTKTGLRPTAAKVLIDATGDANLIALAGFELVRSPLVQPATLIMRCSGYDPAALDYAALRTAAGEAVAAGELRGTDVSWTDNDPETFLRRRGGNTNHIRAPGAETSEGRSAIEIEARRSVLRIHRFFRKQPGLADFRVDWICNEAGVRESVTIKGKTTITICDYETGRFFDDAVCYAFYPVDEHLNDGQGVNWRTLANKVLPTIPRGAMLPEGSRFLLAAGRSVSSDREANSALRVECPCMAMGQAAGAMAALSVQTGVDPECLPLRDIYALLRRHDAIVPGDD